MATDWLGPMCDAIVVAGITNRLEGKRPGEPLHIPAADCPPLADWLRTRTGQQTIVCPEATYLAQLDGDEIILRSVPPTGADRT